MVVEEKRSCPNVLRGQRRLIVLSVMAIVVLAATAARLPTEAARAAPSAQVQTAQDAQTPQAAQIVAIAREAMETYSLNAVIVRVTIDGQEVVTAALGESMTGVPATTDMHFRNGAVAISYVSTLLLRLVDQGVLRLDDPLSIWLPELPDSERVTLRMLANMTAGYPDYVQNPQLSQEQYANPFRQWAPEELIAIGLSTPRLFAPGTNWDYSHTNYVILGLALEKATGTPMAELLRQQVLDPLGLTNTDSEQTAVIRAPVLHAFTSERRQALGIPTGTRFYEESTFWDPSWTITRGAVQTTNIYDMTATAVAVGEGTLLSPASHQAQVAPILLGFGSPLAGCPACHTLARSYVYGLGVVNSNGWLLQNPLFAGYGAVAAYLPSKRIAIAVAVTFGEQSFDDQGNYKYGNASQQIFSAIGAYLAPDEAPPTGP
jgi:CubicO group peptidase (beta-lactamase class C family)